MYANPDLPRLLRALRDAPMYRSHAQILDAALREIEAWRQMTPDPPGTGGVEVVVRGTLMIEMVDARGRPCGAMPVPADVLRAAYCVGSWLKLQPDASALAGVTLTKVNKG